MQPAKKGCTYMMTVYSKYFIIMHRYHLAAHDHKVFFRTGYVVYYKRKMIIHPSPAAGGNNTKKAISVSLAIHFKIGKRKTVSKNNRAKKRGIQ